MHGMVEEQIEQAMAQKESRRTKFAQITEFPSLSKAILERLIEGAVVDALVNRNTPLASSR